MDSFLTNKFVCYLWPCAWADHIDEGWTVTKVCSWDSARIRTKGGMVKWIQPIEYL